MMSDEISAFILGAGLGTRLRPLTDDLPKPLVPVWNRPLIHHAMDHLIADLGVTRFLVNTHHCSDRYGEWFPEGKYRETKVSFRHEPVLLDTAGGLDNIRDWIPADQSFAIYNGDILTDLPLEQAWRAHLDSGNLATLILRSSGDELRVGYDAGTGRIVDLRGALRPEWEERYQFTGIYFVSPEFLPFLKVGEIESIVFPLLRAIEAGAAVGGIVVDEGIWSDLGERDSYLDALSSLRSGVRQGGGKRIDESARIAPSTEVDEVSSIGAEAVIGADCRLQECVIWPGGVVKDGVHLERVVVRSGQVASRSLSDTDL